MGEKIRVVIGGINGKMGRASARCILQDAELQLVGAFGKPGAAYVGADIGDLVSVGKLGILVSSRFQDVIAQAVPDVYLDFTCAEASVETVDLALDKGIRPVVGTSGLLENQIEHMVETAKTKKLGGMIVPNFSVGAVLMMEFARMAGSLFSNVEIVEMHHTRKLDAPSGTAMHTVRKLDSTGSTFNSREVNERELIPGARGAAGAAGVRVHSLRLPGLISHQEVIFGADGELLTIRHDSYNTNCFDKGILMSVKAVVAMDSMEVGLDKLLDLTGAKA